ncbi:MAG: zinc metalloprotease HtpX [Dehalococcoidia bacterium]|uniref:zinc metalloprotease HtpX n=1 Tax=Candidatus Amarobacter glycogenicus TaxID=3140699 RepID=UPI002A0E8F1C|nr:zinc metalloprotease HtpX [Dehalococcoidia bacterium]MBK7329599.1 zinc metalloprotease HtpX [Dehalococcoidia bacterium]MBK8560872.1 zinc metalloprotease HtpX [Dehalococcoidia bacterium]MBK9545627.1 zinc metalloprotease HtpX [Dehalococcoidia bacterium]MBK9610034.1 zinc metalloprotease HtpX [Dehalococcoidia bacterium]
MNFLKTTVLLATLTGLLVAIGGLIGGTGGMIFALIFAGVMNFTAYWFSDKMALRMAGAHQIQESDDPHLFAMVREVAELSRMPMPRVYIIQNDSPNAFATGRDPKHGVVAVTTGIQRLLTDRELRGVLGHEMGHVKNRDILTSSIVATVAGAISMIAQMLMWSSLLGGRRDEQNPLVTLGVILIAPIAASMIQFGISRQREYAADKTGAEVTRDPEALASALEKLQRGVEMRPMRDTPAQEAVSALYIVKPFSMRSGGMSKLFSTHPPLEERIERLRKMRF